MVLILGFFTVCVGVQTSTATAQLDMNAVRYLQELGSYDGLASFSLLPVPILLWFLDN